MKRTTGISQPEDQRKRLAFLCGDPKCRAVARPAVAGALYDRCDAFDPDAFQSDRHRAPYFRRHIRFPHIDGCTWDERADEETRSDDPVEPDHTITIGEQGLVWLPEQPGAARRLAGGIGEGHSPFDEGDGEQPINGHRTRPDSTRFLATVGMSYLKMTDMLRRRIPLQISKKGAKGTFWTVCLPVFAYHPAFRAERVCFGKASIAKLTNIFVLTFKWQFALSGGQTNSKRVVKIKFLKRALEEDRLLGDVLEKAVVSGQDVYCFMYVTELPELKMHGTEPPAWFAPSARDHVFIIPVSTVAAAEGVSDWHEKCAERLTNHRQIAAHPQIQTDRALRLVDYHTATFDPRTCFARTLFASLANEMCERR